MRIVSLEPSVTATLFALGMEAQVVAVTRHCPRLVDTGTRPQLDSTWASDPQTIADLSPDLVIASIPYREGRVENLLKAQLSVLSLYPRSLSDIYQHIQWIGQLGGQHKLAEAIVSEMQSSLQRYREESAGRQRWKIYVEIWPKPLMNASPWVAEMVEAMGHEFILKPAERQLEDADVLAADPDMILLAWAGVKEIDPEHVYQRQGWETTAAVQTRRVAALDEILLNAPGTNLLQGMRHLRQQIAALEQRVRPE